MVEFDRSAFVAKFQEEATDLLQRLNEGVIMLEADPGNRELIEQMLRDAHTLKGSSRMVGLIEISDIAHRLEDIMVMVRDGGMSYVPEMSDSFFEALDAIVFLADNGGENVDSALDLAGLQSRLTKLAGAADEWEDAGDEEASPQHASAPAAGTTAVEASANDASAEPLAADTA
ncbi:MAG: Hpt domain-containing protein, partial [Coriobacteriales bacterium]|nr:Hpt domain-containing protein [Coriobacteriales bacterium]